MVAITLWLSAGIVVYGVMRLRSLLAEMRLERGVTMMPERLRHLQAVRSRFDGTGGVILTLLILALWPAVVACKLYDIVSDILR